MRTGDKKEREVLDYIREQIETCGVPPSLREIGAAVGLKAASSVHAHIKNLADKGLIIYEENKKRAISLPNAVKTVGVPILGRVTAGLPILAVEENEGLLPVSSDVARGRELFALRVRGDSMINAAILDGDLVVVERTPEARNGEIVVALIEDEATVKRFYRENGRFRLQPENDAYEPILVESLTILGRVIASVRYY
ncbi:transcriptional repressor LexA [Feifania hominis]|uniref:LexA repressor n=1 Tax=Feifania hominis TaxID=2763660 RepID=A0A926HV69_9FIRM|nr:transcriptional repressor LexA [Feifania hominis]MBC8537033.1 transcriptional repressor LexA [Feifania hominis]